MGGSQMIEKNDMSRGVDAAEVTPDLFFPEDEDHLRATSSPSSYLVTPFSLISSFFSASFMLLPACPGAHPDVLLALSWQLCSQTLCSAPAVADMTAVTRNFNAQQSLPGLRERC